MWINRQNKKLHVIKYSVLLYLQIFLILVNTENVTDNNPVNEPNITVKSFPYHIEFYIEDPSYNIIEVDCKTEEISSTNCINLEPCSTYQADLKIEYTNSSNNEISTIKNRITVKTNYSEPNVTLMQDFFTTTAYSIYIQWNVKYPKCVGLFKIKATAENKVYMDIQNDRNNATFYELNPCQKYDIEIVTIDIKGKVIEPNLTTFAKTEYDKPDSVKSLRFEVKSSKSIQVFWITPNYTTCINFYDIEWIKESCLMQESASCQREHFRIQNPKSTDHLIDNLKGCENYTVTISTNGDINISISGYFKSEEQKPGPITDFSIVNSTATNVTVNWNLPSENAKCVSIYKANIIGPLQNIVLDKTFTTTERKSFFDDLMPCGKYNISITAISNGSLNSDTVRNTITMMQAKPNPIRNLYVKYYYPHEIILEWQKPNFSELCIDFYRISGWSNDNNTIYEFHNQTNLTTKQISNLVSCMTYIVQIIPVIIGTEPSFDGNPTQLKVETIASTTGKPTVNNPQSTSHSLELRAVHNDDKNFCQILLAKFECSAKDARINYNEKTVEGDTARIFSAIVEPLSPFTKYSCIVYFYNAAGKSLKTDLVWYTDKYYPEEPTDLKVILANNTLYINWNKPIYLNGDLAVYKVFIQIVGPQYTVPLYCKPTQTQNLFYENSKSEYEYKGIQPYNKYSIQVAARNDYGTGKSTKSVVITSPPFISNPVENLKYLSVDGPEISRIYNASVLLQWQPPCKSNGKIKSYHLEFNGTRNDFKNHYFIRVLLLEQINETSNIIEWKESNLQPEYNYLVSVVVEIIGVGPKSEPVSIYFLSPAGIPDVVNDTNSGVVDAFSATNPTSSALVKIPINIFRSEMGKILYAAVLLSEIGCQKDPELISGKINADNNWPNISSWQPIESQACIKQYQTTPEKWQPFINSKSFDYEGSLNSENITIDMIEYVIGKENDCNTEKLYCNGPLKPNTKYKMIIRVFTRNGFADTVSLEFKTDDVVKIYSILIMIVSVLLIAFSLGFIYMWINKRKIWYRQSLIGIEDQCGDVTTRNYLLYYHDLSKKDKILREFKELDVVSNDINSKNIITRHNDSKNRYSNIFPYENNRVILDNDSDGSDYINASFINGYKRKKEYIATQGPKPESCIDFWKMIIQHNVKVIVMLTQLREGDIVKCHQYFPIMSNEMKFGNNITVYCKRQVENDIYERRDMMIKHSGDHIYRNIIHYYFKKWPDHDCPVDAMDLIKFVKRVKSEKMPNRSPIVVHCSAGVGRTGTFIGLDIIMQRMKNEGKINIYETIKQLRFERMKMVQTMQQYQFLYNCIYQLVLNKYSRDSKKNSITTNNSSTVTIITPPLTPATPSIPPLLPPPQLSSPLPALKPLNCNGFKKQENNSGNLKVANNENCDSVSSRNSFFSPNDIESAM